MPRLPTSPPLPGGPPPPGPAFGLWAGPDPRACPPGPAGPKRPRPARGRLALPLEIGLCLYRAMRELGHAVDSDATLLLRLPCAPGLNHLHSGM
jgi:hypothetical protein